MAHLYTDDKRMLDKLYRQGYRDMKRFGYEGLEMDMPKEYYAGVAQAAKELAEDDEINGAY